MLHRFEFLAQFAEKRVSAVLPGATRGKKFILANSRLATVGTSVTNLQHGITEDRSRTGASSPKAHEASVH